MTTSYEETLRRAHKARRVRIASRAVTQAALPAAGLPATIGRQAGRKPCNPVDRDYERAWAAALLGLPEGAPPRVRDIVCATADHFGIDEQALTTHSRDATIANARRIAMYLARKLTRKSFAEIGGCFGRRDHAPAHHAMRRVEQLIATDAETAASVASIRAALGSGAPPQFREWRSWL